MITPNESLWDGKVAQKFGQSAVGAFRIGVVTALPVSQITVSLLRLDSQISILLSCHIARLNRKATISSRC